MTGGDGYILSNEKGKDATLSVTFSLDAVAAAMILRANDDMSDYIIVNCDINEKLVKVWSKSRQIGVAPTGDINTSSVNIKARLIGNEMTVYLNGNQKLYATLDENEPKEGKFGLNVFNGKATFGAVALVKEEYSYDGGDLTVIGDAEQTIRRLYNVTMRNVSINPEFFTSDGRLLVINERYFENLKEGFYTFKAEGGKTVFSFTVDVRSVRQTEIEDVRVQVGLNATIYVGNVEVTSVLLNGEEISDYTFKNKVLYIGKNALTVGENHVSINGEHDVTVIVIE